MINYKNLISQCEDSKHEMEIISDFFIKVEKRFYVSVLTMTFQQCKFLKKRY